MSLEAAVIVTLCSDIAGESSMLWTTLVPGGRLIQAFSLASSLFQN